MFTIPSSSRYEKHSQMVFWYLNTLETFRIFTQPNQALLSPPQPQNINLIVPILPPNSTPAPEVRPPAPDYPDYDSDYSRPDYNDYNYNSGNEPVLHHHLLAVMITVMIIITSITTTALTKVILNLNREF